VIKKADSKNGAAVEQKVNSRKRETVIRESQRTSEKNLSGNTAGRPGPVNVFGKKQNQAGITKEPTGMSGLNLDGGTAVHRLNRVPKR